MNGWRFRSNNWPNTCFLLLTYLLSMFPLLPQGLRSIVLAIWSIAGLLFFYFDRGSIKWQKSRMLSLFFVVSPYVFFVISFFYSFDTDEGLNKLFQILPLILIPVIICMSPLRFKDMEINRALTLFSISVVLIVIYQIFESLLNIEYLLKDLSDTEKVRNGYKIDDVIREYDKIDIKLRRFRSFVIQLIDIHPTYQGLWISLGIYFLGQKAFGFLKSNRLISVLIFMIIGILTAWLLLLSVRMAIVAMVIALILNVIFFVKINRIKKGIFIFLLVLAIPVSYLTIDFIRIRTDEVISTGFEIINQSDDVKTFNSTMVRNGIYFCSHEILKDNWFFGVGIGDVQNHLDNCYEEKLKAIIYTWDTYNSHNQYLFQWLSSGIFGLLSFILTLLAPIILSIKGRHVIYFYLLIVVSLMFLTENILVRSDGLLFYSLFNSLFYSKIMKW